jgi:hypothetical protein
MVSVFSSCSDDGYWDEFKSEGEQYSFITTEISRNFKRATSAEGKDPYSSFTIRRTEASEATALPITVTITVPGTIADKDQETYIARVKNDFEVMNAEGEYVSLADTDYAYALFEKDSYQTDITIKYVGAYNSVRPANVGGTLVLSYADELNSPGGTNSATLSVVVTTSGTE